MALSFTEITGVKGIIDEASVREKYAKLTRCLIETSTTITTMESCTCGQVASLITDIEGASAILAGADITYSNAAKIRRGVPAEIIDTFGVYSPETAGAMAEACRATFGADIHCTVPIQPSRLHYKLYMADVIADALSSH